MHMVCEWEFCTNSLTHYFMKQRTFKSLLHVVSAIPKKLRFSYAVQNSPTRLFGSVYPQPVKLVSLPVSWSIQGPSSCALRNASQYHPDDLNEDIRSRKSAQTCSLVLAGNGNYGVKKK